MVTMNASVMMPSAAKLNTGSGVSAIWRSNIVAGYGILAIAVSIYARITEQKFLSDDVLDGFTIQVTYIWNYIGGRNSILDLEPLLWIHAVRALIAYIFVSLEERMGDGISTFVILIMFAPLLRSFSRLPRGYFIFFVPIAALVFSQRTMLVIMAVAYLMIFIFNARSYLYLAASFILSSLSSGTVMNNLIISVILVRNYHKKSIGLYIYIAALAASLLISTIDKYSGFVEQRAGYSSTVYGASGLQAVISRSTILVSLQEGNYTRFAAYIALATLALFLLFISLKLRRYRGYAAILLSAIPSVLLEGLGFVSLLVPVLMLMAGATLPWRPEPDEVDRG